MGALSRNWFRVEYAEAPSLSARIVDAALIGVSVAIACGSVLFAGAMLATESPPGVSGVQYLAIFAQPKRVLKPGSTESAENVDMSPVGSIGQGGRTAGVDASIVGAAPGFAWVRIGSRVVSVRPNDNMPPFGAVREIRRVDNRWVIFGNGGVELMSSASAPTLADIPGKAPAGHKLVLGGGE